MSPRAAPTRRVPQEATQVRSPRAMQARSEWMAQAPYNEDVVLSARWTAVLKEVSRRPSRQTAFQPTCADPCDLPASRRAPPWPGRRHLFFCRRTPSVSISQHAVQVRGSIQPTCGGRERRGSERDVQ